jgi:hypothetical protein
VKIDMVMREDDEERLRRAKDEVSHSSRRVACQRLLSCLHV